MMPLHLLLLIRDTLFALLEIALVLSAFVGVAVSLWLFEAELPAKTADAPLSRDSTDVVVPFTAAPHRRIALQRSGEVVKLGAFRSTQARTALKHGFSLRISDNWAHHKHPIGPPASS